MSVGTGVKGAINAIAISAERALGSNGEDHGIPAGLVEWGGNRGFHDAQRWAFKNLAGQSSFNSLDEHMGVVWWPPLASGEVPIVVGLTLDEQNGFGIRIALFRWDESGDPKAIGMRFEEPHKGSGAHEFHHAQLWTHIRKGVPADRVIDPDAWIPEKQPSFPLQASNALELLWAAAVSIYGRKDAGRPFEASDTERGKIADYLVGLT